MRGELLIFQEAQLQRRLEKSPAVVKVLINARAVHSDRSSADNWAKLAQPSGLSAVMAESIALKHQLLIIVNAD